MDQYELIPNLTTVVKFLHRLLSIEMPEQLSNSQTPPHTPVKSFQWPKVPQCIYYKLYLLPTTPFKHLNPLTITSQPTCSSSYSFSIVASSLILSETLHHSLICAAPALCISPLNFTYPLAFSPQLTLMTKNRTLQAIKV